MHLLSIWICGDGSNVIRCEKKVNSPSKRPIVESNIKENDRLSDDQSSETKSPVEFDKCSSEVEKVSRNNNGMIDEIFFQVLIPIFFFNSCRHMFHPIGTHQYSQNLKKKSLKLNVFGILMCIGY